jgi:hypothetical protein
MKSAARVQSDVTDIEHRGPRNERGLVKDIAGPFGLCC